MTKSRAELEKQWKVARANLEFARQALPHPPRENRGELPDEDLATLDGYYEALEHNELELALDAMEGLGGLNACRGGFWRRLQTAAELMGLPERAQRLGARFHEALGRVPEDQEKHPVGVPKQPPPTLDGAVVRLWAWSGEEPYFTMMDTEGQPVARIHGLAICEYERSGAVYRFSCDQDWEVQNDAPFNNVEDARNAPSLQYDVSAVDWHRFE